MHFHFCTKELMLLTAAYEAIRNYWYCIPYWKAKMINYYQSVGSSVR